MKGIDMSEVYGPSGLYLKFPENYGKIFPLTAKERKRARRNMYFHGGSSSGQNLVSQSATMGAVMGSCG